MIISELKKKLLHIELLGLENGIDLSIYYWKDKGLNYIKASMFPVEQRN